MKEFLKHKLREELMKNMTGVPIARPDQELVIMRGVSGGGKSTEARKQAGSGVIHSTDDLIEATGDYNGFFKSMIDSGNFGPLSKMHSENLENAKESMDKGISPVVIDNTNLRADEPKAYVEYALKIGFDENNIRIVDIGTGGEGAEVLAKRNSHGVPLGKIEQMIQTHKSVGPLTVVKIMEARSRFDKKSKVLYSGVVLLDKSKHKLFTAIGHMIPEGWKEFGHHMTIIFGKGLKAMDLEDDNGRPVEIKATHVGMSDKAMAVKVEGYPSANDIPHITIAVNPDGGKPAMSNQITDWKKLDNYINLEGTVAEIKP